MGDSNDKELGMQRGITRRDFLNGIAITSGLATLPPHLLAALQNDLAPEKAPNYYPPALTGLRGSHVGSFEAAHSLRDGDFWQKAGAPAETGETFDLIIVGGGISGLSAAYFFRKSNPNARILILENHDDFGGHAKRNEFTVDQRKLLGFGGTFSIESPAPYSSVAKSVVEELGIDVASYSKYVSKNLYSSLGLHPNIFFDKQTFGTDKLVINPAPIGGGENGDSLHSSPETWKAFLAEAPLSEKARRDFQELFTNAKDYLPGLSSDEKKDRFARISYAKFLTDIAHVDEEIVKLYQAAPHGLFGVGIDAVSAQDAWGLGLPGFAGMKLQPGPGKGMNRDAIPNEEAEKYFFHFPDGNASIARMLVRKLIPDAIPGNSATDIVTEKANYAKIDDASSPVRIRLFAARKALYSTCSFYRARVLEHGYSIYLYRVAGASEASPAFRRKSALTLHQCGDPELDVFSKTWRQLGLCARMLPFGVHPGYSGQYRGLPLLYVSRPADRDPHDEDAMQARSACARSASNGTDRIIYH